MSKKVVLLLAEGFEEVEAVTPIDFLRRANIEVIVAGIESTLIKGAHDIFIKADCLIDDLPVEFDGIIIPGGTPGASNIAANPKAIALIQKLKQTNKLVAAICAAPFVVLAAAGVIDGMTVTSFPAYSDKFSKSIYSNERVVVDKNVITSQGPGTAAEFSIKVIEYLAGKAVADKIYSSTLLK